MFYMESILYASPLHVLHVYDWGHDLMGLTYDDVIAVLVNIP